jgi:hypothetical protein
MPAVVRSPVEGIRRERPRDAEVSLYSRRSFKRADPHIMQNTMNRAISESDFYLRPRSIERSFV